MKSSETRYVELERDYYKYLSHSCCEGKQSVEEDVGRTWQWMSQTLQLYGSDLGSNFVLRGSWHVSRHACEVLGIADGGSVPCLQDG
jgi:hypothetical protein